MAAALITPKQLENRLGRDIVRRIYDDNNDGVPDPAPLQQLCEDASSKVRGALPGLDLEALTATDSPLSDLRRIALDAAAAMAAQRHNTGMNWMELMQQVDLDLERIRKGQAWLASKTTPAPADNSVSVVSGDAGQADYWP